MWSVDSKVNDRKISKMCIALQQTPVGRSYPMLLPQNVKTVAFKTHYFYRVRTFCRPPPLTFSMAKPFSATHLCRGKTSLW